MLPQHLVLSFESNRFQKVKLALLLLLYRFSSLTPPTFLLPRPLLLRKYKQLVQFPQKIDLVVPKLLPGAGLGKVPKHLQQFLPPAAAPLDGIIQFHIGNFLHIFQILLHAKTLLFSLRPGLPVCFGLSRTVEQPQHLIELHGAVLTFGDPPGVELPGGGRDERGECTFLILHVIIIKYHMEN